MEKKCRCKYCADKGVVKTTKEIGENYNYSCYYHSNRAKLQWVRLDKLFEAIGETNAKLYADKKGSYEWNEILTRKLGLSE